MTVGAAGTAAGIITSGVCPGLLCDKATSGTDTTPLRGRVLLSTERGTYDRGVPIPTKVGWVLVAGLATGAGKRARFGGTIVTGGIVGVIEKDGVIVVIAPCGVKGSVGIGGAKHYMAWADYVVEPTVSGVTKLPKGLLLTMPLVSCSGT